MMVLLVVCIIGLTFTAMGVVGFALRGQRAQIPVLILMPIIAGALYWGLGAHKAVSDYAHRQDDIAQLRASVNDSPEQLISMMQQKLKQQPDSAKGWFLLGRLYLGMGKFDQAAKSLAKAYKLSPKQPEIIGEYAQALYLANNRVLTKKAQALLQQLLAIDENNSQALNLLAISAYNRQDYTKAIAYWQRVLQQLTPGSADYKAVVEMMEEANKRIYNVQRPT